MFAFQVPPAATANGGGHFFLDGVCRCTRVIVMQRLAVLRKLLRLSQGDLGEAIDRSRATISRVELGTRALRPGEVAALRRVLRGANASQEQLDAALPLGVRREQGGADYG